MLYEELVAKFKAAWQRLGTAVDWVAEDVSSTSAESVELNLIAKQLETEHGLTVDQVWSLV